MKSMKKESNHSAVILGMIFLFLIVLLGMNCLIQRPAVQEMSLEEYLESERESWFLSGKKKYTIQGMMVSKELSFHNDLEDTDYTAEDDGQSVVLKGVAQEMWISDIERVIQTYTKPDGSPLTKEDFREKDVWIDITSIPKPDSVYAMHVPSDIRVTVITPYGYELHANSPGSEHGEGDWLLSSIMEDGNPDVSDVWVLNGILFPLNYDTTHLPEK